MRTGCCCWGPMPTRAELSTATTCRYTQRLLCYCAGWAVIKTGVRVRALRGLQSQICWWRVVQHWLPTTSTPWLSTSTSRRRTRSPCGRWRNGAVVRCLCGPCRRPLWENVLPVTSRTASSKTPTAFRCRRPSKTLSNYKTSTLHRHRSSRVTPWQPTSRLERLPTDS